MGQPYFLPDPSIPDSDLLGYGDLIFDNGKTKYLNGDADLAASLPRQSVDQGPLPGAAAPPSTTVPIPGTDHTLDISTGKVMSSNAGQVSDYLSSTAPQPAPPPGSHDSPSLGLRRDQDLASQMDQLSGTAQPEQSGAGPGAPPTVPIPGTDHAIDIDTGRVIEGGAAQAGYGTGGLQLAQREGALPPDVAAQQAAERQDLNSSNLAATAISRRDESDVYRQAALKRQGELDAERQAQQKALDEQQAKQQRWQQEQRDTAKMDIRSDIFQAKGDIGGLLSIVGAGLLMAVKSDAGLRMIDSAVNRDVERKMSMRDSKLRVLADQLGSTEQAIAAGKAAMYKIAGDYAETTQQLTKADAFEAQTPEILSGLRQKQQQYEQEQQRISLGKTLEKAPVAAQPKAIDVEKYGKAAAEQAQQEKNIQRAANAIGLTGWDPESGKFSNREEILKNGIPGVGKLDAFLQGVPGLRNIDNAATSAEGQKVRAALEGLVAAEAKAQNPGRAPTDADRDAARITLGLNTEQGTVAAIERLMGQQGQYKAQNTAAYGNAASTYENRIDQMGARPPQANGPVDTGRPLEPGKARQMLEQERSRQPAPTGPQASATPMQDVAGEIQAVAGREIPPEGLKILVAQAAHETGDGQHAPGNNFFGIKGKGNNLETTEGEGPNARLVRSDFRAYQSPTESVQDVVSLLQRKYPDAWRALQMGDAPAYVAALKDGGYFTGSETEYLNGIQRRL